MAKQTTSTTQNGGSRPVAPAKTPAAGAADRAPARSGPNLVNFFQESRAELRKVTWPTRQEATNLTIAVIGMTIAIAVFLGVIDAGLDKLVQQLIG